MGFFAEFNLWLNTLLNEYISRNTNLIARALEPAIVTCATIYIMIWGYLHLMGRVEEPFVTGLKRIVMLAVILVICFNFLLYNAVIVDTFFNAPGQLAARIAGATDYVTVVDQIIFTGGDVAEALLEKGGFTNIGYFITGLMVYAIVGVTAIYTIFLLTLARVGLSVLLALGPLFITLLFFDATRRFFESWIALMANFALTAILTVLIAALMMQIIGDAIDSAARTGGDIEISQAVRVCMASGLTFLIMRQVLTISASLSGGYSMHTLNVVSNGARMLLGPGKLAAGGIMSFGRGIVRGPVRFTHGALMKRDLTQKDTLARRGGKWVGNKVRQFTQRQRENRIAPGE